MSRRLVDITDEELLQGIKKLLPDSDNRFSKKPPVTPTYAAAWLGFNNTQTVYNWIKKKKLKTTPDGKIPFSELIRLDKA